MTEQTRKDAGHSFVSMQNGWIKLHRRSFDNALYFRERFTSFQAWIDLILLANHTTKTFRLHHKDYTVNRGQLAYSMVSLAERWRWNRKSVSRFLRELKSEGMLDIRTTPETTVITILNYARYQDGANRTDSGTDNRMDNRTDTNKNVKNDKNVKKYIHRGDALTLPVELDTEAVRTTWEDFRQHRTDSREPMTEKAEGMAIKKLLKLSRGMPELAIEVIEQSIVSNWQGLFGVKNGTSGTGGKSAHQERAEYRIDEKRAKDLRDLAESVDRL